MPSNDLDKIYEQNAIELPSKKEVKLRMKNLRLHSCGIFSNVYRGTLLSPKPMKEIALKKTWPEIDTHINIEVEILLRLHSEQHKNIVRVLYAFQSITPDKRLCHSTIFEYLPQTVANIVKQIGGKNPDYVDIKLYSWQLFNGLAYLSKKSICHRDIKPQNLLIEPIRGQLKIADFGSAKIIRKATQSSSYQVTRFYRPPELLLEATFYTPQVDVWSGGCVVGEITRGSILFPGRETKHQLKLIINALGSPSEKELRNMKVNIQFSGSRVAPNGFRPLLPYASQELISILQRILVYSPKKRLCGKALLSDPFFQELFLPGKRRTNGRYVSNAITTDDLQNVPELRKIGRSRQSAEESTASTITTSAEASTQKAL